MIFLPRYRTVASVFVSVMDFVIQSCKKVWHKLLGRPKAPEDFDIMRENLVLALRASERRVADVTARLEAANQADLDRIAREIRLENRRFEASIFLVRWYKRMRLCRAINHWVRLNQLATDLAPFKVTMRIAAARMKSAHRQRRLSIHEDSIIKLQSAIRGNFIRRWFRTSKDVVRRQRAPGSSIQAAIAPPRITGAHRPRDREMPNIADDPIRDKAICDVLKTMGLDEYHHDGVDLPHWFRERLVIETTTTWRWKYDRGYDKTVALPNCHLRVYCVLPRHPVGASRLAQVVVQDGRFKYTPIGHLDKASPLIIYVRGGRPSLPRMPIPTVAETIPTTTPHPMNCRVQIAPLRPDPIEIDPSVAFYREAGVNPLSHPDLFNDSDKDEEAVVVQGPLTQLAAFTLELSGQTRREIRRAYNLSAPGILVLTREATIKLAFDKSTQVGVSSTLVSPMAIQASTNASASGSEIRSESTVPGQAAKPRAKVIIPPKEQLCDVCQETFPSRKAFKGHLAFVDGQLSCGS